MYWESLYPGAAPAVSQFVEDCAKWVQWAFNGLSGDETTFRYNLNQFWAQKQAGFYSETSEGQAQLQRLDMTAHGLLNALDMGKITSASPSYWAQFTALLTGSTPARPDSDVAAAEARQAAIDAAQAASDAGLPSVASYFNNVATKQVDADLASQEAIWSNPGGFFGAVPMWAWVAIAAGAAFFFMRRK